MPPASSLTWHMAENGPLRFSSSTSTLSWQSRRPTTDPIKLLEKEAKITEDNFCLRISISFIKIL